MQGFFEENQAIETLYFGGGTPSVLRISELKTILIHLKKNFNLDHLQEVTLEANPDDLDALPFPRRSTFYEYYDKPIASILSSRGCWRDCAFCSINA